MPRPPRNSSSVSPCPRSPNARRASRPKCFAATSRNSDSTYAYDPALGHADKLARWLKSSGEHFLTVLAYDDANGLLDGKPFVSATGGTWYRSHLMLTNLATHFAFTRADADGFQNSFSLEHRVQFLLKENPDRKVLHTIQVERNGFIHAMLAGTPLEGRGYEYFGPRAYEAWIEE